MSEVANQKKTSWIDGDWPPFLLGLVFARLGETWDMEGVGRIG